MESISPHITPLDNTNLRVGHTHPRLRGQDQFLETTEVRANIFGRGYNHDLENFNA